MNCITTSVAIACSVEWNTFAWLVLALVSLIFSILLLWLARPRNEDARRLVVVPENSLHAIKRPVVITLQGCRFTRTDIEEIVSAIEEAGR